MSKPFYPPSVAQCPNRHDRLSLGLGSEAAQCFYAVVITCLVGRTTDGYDEVTGHLGVCPCLGQDSKQTCVFLSFGNMCGEG